MKPGKIVYQGKTKKGTEILIRYPTKDDAYELRDFINAVSKEKTYIMFQGEQLSLEEETKYLNSFLDKIEKDKAIKLFVFTGNKLIGASDIIMQEKTSSHVGVFGIIIAKKYRGKKIGEFLIKLVLKEAEKNIKNLRIVILEVFANNPIAPNLYKKFGFVKYGRLPGGLKHKNQFVDDILMYKTFSS